VKYCRRKKCKCEQYNHNAWSQDLMKNMGLGETNMYIPWYVMCKLMINLCLCLMEWCQCSWLKLSQWSNNAENKVESEGLVKKGVICNCWLVLHAFTHLLVWCHGSLQHTLQYLAEIRSTYKILIRKPQMTSRHKWEYTIKINHGETECKYECWIKD
jgi:hypothetical protein